MRAAFSAFALRDYRLMWGGSLFATTAFMTTFLLVPVVAYEITGSYAASGLAQMGSGIAQILLGPLGGVIADRYPKKPLVLTGQAAPGLIIVGTGALILTDLISIPLLFLSTLLMGCGFALMGPARQAWLGELVPRRMLANAVALQQIALNVAQVAGPTTAAVCVVLFGLDTGWLYLLVASFFLVVIPMTTRLPWTQPANRGPRRAVRQDLADGFRYVIASPRLRYLWFYLIVMVMCGFAFQTLMPGILDREYGRLPNESLVIYLVFGIAALIINVPLAGLVSGRWAWPSLLVMGLLTAVGAWLVALSSTFGMILFMGAFVGAGRSGVMLVNRSLMMMNSRPEFYGRVMSVGMMGFGFQAILSPVWGGIADAIGGRETLFIVGVVALLATGLMTIAWLRTRNLPVDRTTAAAEIAGSPGPQPTPAFTAQLAPVALMDPQKPPLSGRA